MSSTTIGSGSIESASRSSYSYSASLSYTYSHYYIASNTKKILFNFSVSFNSLQSQSIPRTFSMVNDGLIFINYLIVTLTSKRSSWNELAGLLPIQNNLVSIQSTDVLLTT